MKLWKEGNSNLPDVGLYVAFEARGTHVEFRKYHGMTGEVISHRVDPYTKDILAVVEFITPNDWPAYLGLHSFVLEIVGSKS